MGLLDFLQNQVPILVTQEEEKNSTIMLRNYYPKLPIPIIISYFQEIDDSWSFGQGHSDSTMPLFEKIKHHLDRSFYFRKILDYFVELQPAG